MRAPCEHLVQSMVHCSHFLVAAEGRIVYRVFLHRWGQALAVKLLVSAHERELEKTHHYQQMSHDYLPRTTIRPTPVYAEP